MDPKIPMLNSLIKSSQIANIENSVDVYSRRLNYGQMTDVDQNKEIVKLPGLKKEFPNIKFFTENRLNTVVAETIVPRIETVCQNDKTNSTDNSEGKIIADETKEIDNQYSNDVNNETINLNDEG